MQNAIHPKTAFQTTKYWQRAMATWGRHEAFGVFASYFLFGPFGRRRLPADFGGVFRLSFFCPVSADGRFGRFMSDYAKRSTWGIPNGLSLSAPNPGVLVRLSHLSYF